MKKNTTKEMASVSPVFYKKLLFSLFLFALILPLSLKVFLDTPGNVLDYLCNSYAGVYAVATSVGLFSVQILSVISGVLRAGFIGCVLSILLYIIGRKASKVQILGCLSVALISPVVVSSVGLLLNYACVSVGINRDTMGLFRAKLPQLMLAARIEYVLYVVLVVCATLVLYGFSQKKKEDLFADGKEFFPRSILFRAVTIAVMLFGIVSLLMTISDTVIDLKTYAGITDSFAGIMAYLVLPYVYLILNLAAMLFFAALTVRKLDRKWNSCKENGR